MLQGRDGIHLVLFFRLVSLFAGGLAVLFRIERRETLIYLSYHHLVFCVFAIARVRFSSQTGITVVLSLSLSLSPVVCSMSMAFYLDLPLVWGRWWLLLLLRPSGPLFPPSSASLRTRYQLWEFTLVRVCGGEWGWMPVWGGIGGWGLMPRLNRGERGGGGEKGSCNLRSAIGGT